jgi:Ca2+-binding RTX toxin-like protein
MTIVSGTYQNETLYGLSSNDSLDGGAGSDTLFGLDGDDYLFGGLGGAPDYMLGWNDKDHEDGTDRIFGGAGNDTLKGSSGEDWWLDAGGIDSYYYPSAADNLHGGAGDDLYLVYNIRDGIIEQIGEGTDTIRLFGHNFGGKYTYYNLPDHVENIEFYGSALNVIGNALANRIMANRITGNEKRNSLDGGAGIDTLIGSTGNDTYFADVVGDVALEYLNEGTDLVVAGVNGYTLGDNVENLLLAGSIQFGNGNALANTLTGNDAANILDGGAGIDTLVGGVGSDTLIVDDNADRVVELAAGGHDFVQSTASNFTLPSNVEDLQLLGNAAISGRGNSLANILTGNAAANTLNGLSGNDALLGGGGNDTLGVGLGLATVIGGVGSDLLQIDWSSITGGMLARSIQKIGTGAAVTYKGSYAAKDITGKVLTQVNFDSIEQLSLNGVPINLAEASAPGVVANRLSTAAKTSETGDKVDFSVALNVAPKGNVTLRFQSSDLTEGKVLNPDITFTPTNWDRPQKLTVQGVDDLDNDGNIGYTISGKVVTNDLTYNRISVPSFNLTNQEDKVDAPLTFDGTKAVDYFQGNNGNDRIYGDNGQDQLKGGRGNDRIYGENDNDRLFGELGDDELYGGYDDDTLDGGAGNDSLFGEQGRDTLLGGAGNDYLDGGLLNDSMSGGAGNDTYLVDNASDIINDLGATTDVDTVLVIQTISYTLPANVENASITASGNANLTGNALNNGLTGNDSKNTLDGGVGNDKLDGGAGPDKLIGGVGNDALIGGSGNDTFLGGEGVDLADFAAAGLDVNVDLTSGKAVGDGTDLILDIENILAGEGNDTLSGSAAGNDIDGGAGTDLLKGGGGNDTLAGCFYGKDGGQYEIDTLVGGVGNDIFQLGYSSGRFYDDGNAKNAGRTDYVLITDFTVGQDKLQLDGAATNYYLAASGVTGVTGTGLYAEQGATDELIAIIRSANTTALNAANTINTALFV